jgi:hypothetical protein
VETKLKELEAAAAEYVIIPYINQRCTHEHVEEPWMMPMGTLKDLSPPPEVASQTGCVPYRMLAWR